MKIGSLVSIIFAYIALTLAGLFSRHPAGFQMEFVDVGQGDSTLITTQNGKRILIDGGDNFTIDYELAKLMPFYNCNLDAVILTHPHDDHLIGLNRILTRCKVSTVMFNDVDFTSRTFSDFKELTKNISTRNLYKGDEFEIDGVSFEVLWPEKEFTQTKSADINDYSIVLLVDYGDFEALLLGDINGDKFQKFDIGKYSSLIDGDFDVVKVSHHGSKYGVDKPFYAALKPKTCVISVGADNKFGHPDKGVLDFLSGINCNILRTDEKGNIVLKPL